MVLLSLYYVSDVLETEEQQRERPKVHGPSSRITCQ